MVLPLEEDIASESPYFDLHDGHVHALARVRQIRSTAQDWTLHELHPLLVVNLATSFEWFARAMIKNLIDFAPDQINSDARVIRELKLNYSTIIRTHKNQFSIGDLIALNRNFGSFDDIQETLLDLVAKPNGLLTSKLKMHLRIGRLKDKTIASMLNRMFRTRHELVHGSPRHLMFGDERALLVSDRDLLIYCQCIEIYIRNFDAFMRKSFRSYSDMTTLQMRMSQADRLTSTDDRIAELEEALEKRLDPETAIELHEAQKAWRQWRDCEAELQSHIWRGGTFRNVARLGEATSIGTQRIRQLEFLLRESQKQP